MTLDYARNAELFFDALKNGAIDTRPLISQQSPYEEGP